MKFEVELGEQCELLTHLESGYWFPIRFVGINKDGKAVYEVEG